MNVGLDLGTRRVAAACPQLGLAFSLSIDNARMRRDYPSESDAGYAMGRQLAILLMNHTPYIEPGSLRFRFERPMAVMSIKTAIGQAFSAGALLSQLVPYGHATECSNSQWKKELIGHGRADKDTIRAWLASHHPALAEVCGEDQDLVDAHCIALWAELAS